MGKTVIFIIIACVLIVVWSACVMAARADEKLREIMDDKKEPEDVYCRSCVDKIENYMKNGYTKDNERERDPDKTNSRETTEERKMI